MIVLEQDRPGDVVLPVYSIVNALAPSIAAAGGGQVKVVNVRLATVDDVVPGEGLVDLGLYASRAGRRDQKWGEDQSLEDL